ncbi:MAG: DUF3592 domain-containing protein [Pyrinomonadaceae bacterium]
MNNQIFGYISIAVGICVGIYFAWTLKRQLATRKWIVVSGKVLESRILDHGSSLEPYVKYSYIVRSANYISDNITPNKYVFEQPASESSLNRMIAPYPVGKTIKVYFDPQDPQNAVLKKNDSILGNIVFVVVSLIFIVVGYELMMQK